MEVWHNPNCSKSNKTIEILKDNNIKFTVLNYLNTPPSKSRLKKVLQMLNLSCKEYIRHQEDDFKQNDEYLSKVSEDELMDFTLLHPKLMQRPVVILKDQAVIARPPEKVLDLIKN